MIQLCINSLGIRLTFWSSRHMYLIFLALLKVVMAGAGNCGGADVDELAEVE